MAMPKFARFFSDFNFIESVIYFILLRFVAANLFKPLTLKIGI